MNILAFESSCDETAAAVVRDGRQVLSDAILSQADMHAVYGGVVPEIASRKHVEAIAALSDRALAEAGVDLLAAETLMGTEEALALLDAASSVCDLPVLCAFSAEADGGVLFGGSVREAALAVQEMGAAAVGVNCSVGPDQLEAVIRTIREAVDIPVVAKPNAGLPVMDERGQARYGMGPADFVRHMLALAEAGAGLLGGCCGTTPEYIRRLAAAL